MEMSYNVGMNYWLMKSEPDCYSIADLKYDKKSAWDGIRNYQVRNMIRDDMHIGDQVLFYHSNSKEIGVVGTMKIVSKPYPDPTQFVKTSDHFDPKSKKESPTWLLVDVHYESEFLRAVTLEEIKNHPKLSKMVVAQKGCRLSITPVKKEEYREIVSMGNTM